MGRGKRSTQGSTARCVGKAKAEVGKAVEQWASQDGLRVSRPLRLMEYAVPVLLAAVCLAVYWQVSGHEFIYYDDRTYVFENRHVLTGLGWENVKWAFTSFYASNWHPLTWLSHMADMQIWGLNPGMHHLTNVFLHTLNAILLFVFLRFATGEFWKSTVVAALFALHPLHVESVAWVAERKDVLSTLFWMLTMIGYVWYVRQPSVKRYLLVVGCFALGLMAKPMLVTLPFVLLLLDYWPLKRPVLVIRAEDAPEGGTGFLPIKSSGVIFLVREKIPLFALTALSCTLTFIAQKGGGAVKAVAMDTRIANALTSYASYLWKTIWPVDLAVYYPLSISISPLEAIGALVFVMLVTAAVLLLARKLPYLVSGWLWYLGTLVPVVGFIQVGTQSMADRYTYVPLIGIFIMAAWGVPELAKSLSAKREILGASAAAVLIVLTILSWRQIGFWKDTISLFTHSLSITRNNHVAHTAMGSCLVDRGDMERSIRHYSESLRLEPDNPKTLYDMGVVLDKKGELDEAMKYYLRAIEINPSMDSAYVNLGVLQLKKGNIQDAISLITRAIQISPGRPEVYYSLGLAYEKGGRFQEAVEQYSKALNIDSGYFRAYRRLGCALVKGGRNDEAARCYIQALKFNPSDLETRVNLAAIYLGTGKLDEAIELYRKALQAPPGIPVVHTGLGLALLQKGNAKEAIVHFRESLRLAPGNAGVMMNLKRAEAMIGR